MGSLVRHTLRGGEAANMVRAVGAQHLRRGEGYLISSGLSVSVTSALLRVKIREIRAAFLEMDFGGKGLPED